MRALSDDPAVLVGCSFGALGTVAVPTLIVVGEQDIADVHAHCGAIETAIPGARRVVLPGSGHVVHLEVSDAFNRLLLDFLAETRDRPPAVPT